MASDTINVSGTVTFEDGDLISEQNLTEAAAKRNQTDYVERGLGLNAAGDGTVDIGSGHAVVQDGTQAWDVKPDAASLTLPNSATNYIYVTIDDAANSDAISYHIDGDQTPPSTPSLLIGTAEGATASSSPLNRAPDGEFSSLDTAELSGTYPTKVRGMSQNGAVSSIDQSSTTTPVGDAIDTVRSDGGGVVELPPGDTVSEGATLPDMDGITLVSNDATIKFVHGGDGLVVDGNVSSGRTTIVGDLTLDGNGANASAVRFANGGVREFNVEYLSLRSWGTEPLVHFDSGHPYSSTWGAIDAQSGLYDAPALQVDDGGPGFSIKRLSCGRSGTGNEVVSQFAGGSPTISIGEMNVGGNSETTILLEDPEDGAWHFGRVNIETGANTFQAIELRNEIDVNINTVKATGGTYDRIVALNGTGRNRIGSINNSGATINDAKVAATGDVTAFTTYGGPSSEVTNLSGSNLTVPIQCLGDGSTVT